MHPSELESRIFQLRARVRRLLALHGLSLVVALLVPLVIVAVLADWLIHLDAAVRMALLLGLIGLGGWLAYRHVITPLVVRFRDLDIALRIERRWPGLNDRLASTVQFFRIAADDDRLGSPALREATVRQTMEETALDRLPRGRRSPPGAPGAGMGVGVGRGRAPPRGGLAPAERDRPAAALPADGRRPLAPADAPEPGRRRDAADRGARRAVRAGRRRGPRGERPLVGVGDLPLRRMARASPRPSGRKRGASSAAGSSRSRARSPSRSRRGTIRPRSATSP